MTKMLDRFQVDDLLREAWRRSPHRFGRALAENGLRPRRKNGVVTRKRGATARDAILTMLRGTPHGLSFKEIAARINRHPGTTLGRLIAKGTLTRSARGHYFLVGGHAP